MWDFVSWLDYWVERYQTLLTAIIAIAGVYWALLPAWRQISLTEGARHLARYHMLAKAISLVDPDLWRGGRKFTERFSPEMEGRSDLREKVRAAYDDRKRSVEMIQRQLREELEPDQYDRINPLFQPIWDRFSRDCDFYRSGGDPAVDSFPEFIETQEYYMMTEYPDVLIINTFANIRRELDALAGREVEQIAAKG